MRHDEAFRHHQVQVSDGDVHVVEIGPQSGPVVMFLHGWPQTWFAFRQVMQLASRSMALDLPGIGESYFNHASGRKREIARIVHDVIGALGLQQVTLVGHDCGGQVVYAYLTQYDEALHKAVILDVVVPGVEPWSNVIRNPHIWHFAFHSIPNLPEELVGGKQVVYFDFFYQATAAHPEAITLEARQVYAAGYAAPVALRTGFDWYRAFDTDANDNRAFAQQNGVIRTPVLYLRGDKGWARIETYVEGFRAAGIQDIQSGLIQDSGHFAAEEQPERLWQRISDFVRS